MGKTIKMGTVPPYTKAPADEMELPCNLHCIPPNVHPESMIRSDSGEGGMEPSVPMKGD